MDINAFCTCCYRTVATVELKG